MLVFNFFVEFHSFVFHIFPLVFLFKSHTIIRASLELIYINSFVCIRIRVVFYHSPAALHLTTTDRRMKVQKCFFRVSVNLLEKSFCTNFHKTFDHHRVNV